MCAHQDHETIGIDGVPDDVDGEMLWEGVGCTTFGRRLGPM